MRKAKIVIITVGNLCRPPSHYWQLMAANNRVLGSSEMAFPTYKQAISHALLVKRLMVEAEVVDE